MSTDEQLSCETAPPLCGAMTGVLNCGCCDEVRLSCTLNVGHEGLHYIELYAGGVLTPIRWAFGKEDK